MSIDLKIKQLAKDYAAEVVANRHYLHTNPELSFQEYNTAKFVAQKLKDIGLIPQEGIANTGVVPLLKAETLRAK